MDMPGAKDSSGATAAALGIESLAEAAKDPAMMAQAQQMMQDPQAMDRAHRIGQTRCACERVRFRRVGGRH